MKRSTTPTHILIKAYTTSEWDEINFALIELTEQFVTDLQKRGDIADNIKTNKEDTDLHNISWWDNRAEFFIEAEDPQDFDSWEETLNNEEHCFVELEFGERLKSPAQTIDGMQMLIYSTGSAKFIGYGKHTSEEFKTEDFDRCVFTANWLKYSGIVTG